MKTNFIDFSNELPEYFYHGSNKYFDKFTLDNLGKNFHQSTLGIYFTQYLEPVPYGSTAMEYAEEMVRRYGGNPYIYKCKIHVKNPLILDSDGWYSSATFIDKNRNDIKRYVEKGNNDSVIAYDFSEKDIRWRDYQLVAKDLSIIEIIDIFEYKRTKKSFLKDLDL